MRKIIQTPAAPAAVGPYSQAVASGDLLYTAGQVPLDPATGKLVPGDIGAQTHQVMKNLAAVLAAAGGSFADVVKTTCFLADMADFAAFNAVYAEYFAGMAPPARSTVAVAGLPLGARVEVELLARLSG
jgi:2-iminobutanoate/2-iminopropanoate deaminase